MKAAKSTKKARRKVRKRGSETANEEKVAPKALKGSGGSVGTTAKKKPSVEKAKSTDATRRSTSPKAVPPKKMSRKVADKEKKPEAGPETRSGKSPAAVPARAVMNRSAKSSLREYTAAIGEIVSPELPEEYGENEFFLIPVEPRVVYASWEITGDSLPAEKEGLEVRFFEVMPGEGGKSDIRAFLDIAIPERVGDGFFHVGIHGREMIAEIGYREADGTFIPVLRSRRVLIPSSLERDSYDTSAGTPRTESYGSRPPRK